MASLSPRALYRLHLATARYFDTAVPALKPLLSLGLLPQSPLPPTDRAALAAFLSGASAPPPAALQPPPTATRAVYSAPRSLAPFVAATARARSEGAGALSPSPSPTAAQSELARLADLGALFASSAAGARAAAALAPHTAAAAHLAAAPLAEADAVRPGTLLLEHPSLLLPGRGVLLIYDIAQGINEVEGHTRWTLRALALNRPLHATVSAALPHLAGALGALGALPLFYGGPDGPGELSIVHKLGDLPGAVPLDGLAPPLPHAGLDAGGGSGSSGAGEDISAARSGLYLGGELEAFEQALAQGRAQPGDFRVTVGRTEMQLEEEAGGALRLPQPYGGDAQLCAAGPGVAAHALCPVLVQEEEGGGEGAAPAPAPLGYDFSRFWHQNVAWSAAVAGVAAWVEVGEAARGREMRQWASPLCHAAVAHYYAGGMGREEFLQLEEALRQERA